AEPIAKGLLTFLGSATSRLFPCDCFHQLSNVLTKINHGRIDGVEVWFGVKIQSAVQEMVDAIGNVKFGLGGGVSVDHIEHSIHFFIGVNKRLLGNAVCFYGMVVRQFLCVLQ